MMGDTDIISQLTAVKARHKALVKLLEERDRRYNQRSVAQDDAVKAALATSKEAVVKAESATEKRFDSVNEFRQTLSDQATNFLSRNEYFASHKALEDKVSALADRLSTDESVAKGRVAGVGSVGTLVLGAFVIISAFGSIASALFAFMAKH
jgi:hypothetical protein